MTSMLLDAVNLMLIGMATVFCFLLVLTAFVSLLTRLLPHQPAAKEASKGANQGSSAAATSAPSAAEMAAITAAVARYRKSHSSH